MASITPLYQQQQTLNAQWTQFAGWKLPLHYGSQLVEHHAVRKNVGIFDVSHMGIVDIKGENAKPFLRILLANDTAKLKNGDALYSCMLNEKGGVIDDLIVYCIDNQHYRIIWNAGTSQSDFDYLSGVIKERGNGISLVQQKNLGMVAIQGSNSIKSTEDLFPLYASKIAKLKPFQFFCENGIWFARTGYTGETGLEIMAPAQKIIEIWQKFIEIGVQPCGLGARDTLRLEAGFNLYEHEMTEKTSPLISNLAWTVDFSDKSRQFIGKSALLKEKSEGIKQKLVGLVLKEGGILRAHQKVWVKDIGEGEITSGGFSPTLNLSIALARLPIETQNRAEVERRGQRLMVEVVKPTFVRNGKSLLDLNA